jgi:hypothetical protein
MFYFGQRNYWGRGAWQPMHRRWSGDIAPVTPDIDTRQQPHHVRNPDTGMFEVVVATLSGLHARGKEEKVKFSDGGVPAFVIVNVQDHNAGCTARQDADILILCKPFLDLFGGLPLTLESAK